jgi:hypothetical protein
VVESNIHYPTDASLLSDCARVITRTIKKIKEQVAVQTEFNNRRRSIKKKIFSVAKVLKRRTNETRQEVKEITSHILRTVRDVVGQAEQIVTEVKQSADTIKAEPLEQVLETTKKIIAQTVSVLGLVNK